MLRRLNREMDVLNQRGETTFSINSYQKDPTYYIISLEGPRDSPYEHGVFNIRISYPGDYPFKPPLIQFMTKIFHPSVYENGEVCVCCSNILGDDWSPRYTIFEVIDQISSMLVSFPLACLNDYSKQLYESNREEFMKTAKEWTLKYAK